MESDIVNLLIKITSTALPGYFAYYIFQKFNLISLSPKKIQDNKSILTIFSTLNILIGMLIYHNNNSAVSLMFVFKTMVTLSLLTGILLPFLVKTLQSVIARARKKLNLAVPTFTTNWKQAFDNNKPKIVHIYTFAGDFIYSGELSKTAESNEWDYYDMLFENNLECKNDLTEKETLNAFKHLESKGFTSRVYLDMEKSLKYYILEYNEN